MRTRNGFRFMAAALVALLMHPVAFAVDATEQLRLRWAVDRSVFVPASLGARSRAVLTLTNVGTDVLPAQGWALYFNCIAGVDTNSTEGHVMVEQVAGTLFRLRPANGFKAVAAGAAVSLPLLHPEVMIRTDKAPTGPYLVFDHEPGVAHAIADYSAATPTAPAQLETAPGVASTWPSAEETFRRNERIADLAENALPPVFPTPLQFARQGGTVRFATTPIISAAPSLRREVDMARDMLVPYFAAQRPVAGAPKLQLLVAAIPGQASPEAYQLTITAQTGVAITGNTAAAVSRGLQSLRQLLPLHPEPEHGFSLPALEIVDAPRFAFRGLLLDVARNFHPKETVFRVLDLMARYKLNKFHFHLADDEGWRLEIAGIPELTSVGAVRGHGADSSLQLPPAYGSGPDVRTSPGSGYYNRADYIEILKYAAARHIEVIPEIEMPGHARAAVMSMQARFKRLDKSDKARARQFLLNDPEDVSQYRSAQLYNDNVMNPGMASTYAFIEHVIAEVVALHKQSGTALRTLHVGGDELANGAWEKSPAVRALMSQQKLASTPDVWNFFYDRIDGMLHKHGLVASGWEELGARKVKVRGEGKLIPNPAFVHRGFELFVWNNLDDAQDLAYRLANAGYKVVLAPATKMYFDMAYNANPEEHGVNWAAYTDLDDVYDFIPFDALRTAPTYPARVPGMDGLTDYAQKNILGLEGTLFSETMRDAQRIDVLLMPRMLGLAERAWAPDPAWAQATDSSEAAALHARAWSVFMNQVGKQVLPQVDAASADIHYRIPPPGLMRSGGAVLVNHQFPGFILRYTVNGDEPDTTSSPVVGPITETGVVKVSAFASNGRHGLSSHVDNP